MSNCAASTLKAVAFQLVAALEEYEADTVTLTHSRFDTETYRKVSGGIDAVERYSAAVPVLSVPAVALLIAHTDLIYALWRVHYGHLPATHAELKVHCEKHSACIESLRTGCLKYLRVQR